MRSFLFFLINCKSSLDTLASNAITGVLSKIENHRFFKQQNDIEKINEKTDILFIYKMQSDTIIKYTQKENFRSQYNSIDPFKNKALHYLYDVKKLHTFNYEFFKNFFDAITNCVLMATNHSISVSNYLLYPYKHHNKPLSRDLAIVIHFLICITFLEKRSELIFEFFMIQSVDDVLSNHEILAFIAIIVDQISIDKRYQMND